MYGACPVPDMAGTEVGFLADGVNDARCPFGAIPAHGIGLSRHSHKIASSRLVLDGVRVSLPTPGGIRFARPATINASRIPKKALRTSMVRPTTVLFGIRVSVTRRNELWDLRSGPIFRYAAASSERLDVAYGKSSFPEMISARR